MSTHTCMCLRRSGRCRSAPCRSAPCPALTPPLLLPAARWLVNAGLPARPVRNAALSTSIAVPLPLLPAHAALTTNTTTNLSAAASCTDEGAVGCHRRPVGQGRAGGQARHRLHLWYESALGLIWLDIRCVWSRPLQPPRRPVMHASHPPEQTTAVRPLVHPAAPPIPGTQACPGTTPTSLLPHVIPSEGRPTSSFHPRNGLPSCPTTHVPCSFHPGWRHRDHNLDCRRGGGGGGGGGGAHRCC